MAIDAKQKEHIKQVIANCLRNKFRSYKWKHNSMPFHFRLLGKDRMAVYSFVQSLNTAFGTSIFEPVAVALANQYFVKAEAKYVVGKTIYDDCRRSIQNIIDDLTEKLITTNKHANERTPRKVFTIF